MLGQAPGVLAGQRPQSPQIIGVPYSQSVPCTGPGSAPGPGLLSQTVMYNPVHQRRGLSLEQQQHSMRPRELYAPGMGLLSHSPGTSPSQSPGPPLQRPGMQDKGRPRSELTAVTGYKDDLEGPAMIITQGKENTVKPVLAATSQ